MTSLSALLLPLLLPSPSHSSLLSSTSNSLPSFLQWLQGIKLLPSPPTFPDPPRLLWPPNNDRSSCRPCSRISRLLFSSSSTSPCCPLSSCSCGLARTRIVGGTEVTRGKYPWIAAINFRGNTGKRPGGCAATLIAANWAVTAAHCIPTLSFLAKWTMSLVLGEHDISSIDASDIGIRKNVKLAMNPIVHERYNFPRSLQNDIALLKLATHVDLTTYTPACLPTANTDYTGQKAWTYGWGTIDSCASSLSAVMREVEVPVVSDAACEASSSTEVTVSYLGKCITTSSSYSGRITDDMLCAGETGKDACQGDSGGPLTSLQSGRHTLIGVVSWGAGCGAAGLPGVYAEVARQRDWIDNKVAWFGGATYCAN